MRTAYLGTSEFAARVLDLLAGTTHRPELVVSRPDRPRGRGRRVAAPPVAGAAQRLGIALLQPEDVNDEDSRDAIAAAEPDAVIVCAYGALLREPLLSDHELLNVHPSLLPRWRGAAPVERAIEAGDERTGVSVMRPVAELDAGPVCLQRSEPIRADDDFGSLSGRLAALSGELLVEALDERPPFREQPEQGMTYAERIEPAERRLDPALGSERLERRVRALSPHVGTWVELPGDERLGVLRATVSGGPGPAPGQLADAGGRLLYGAAGGALELLEVRPAGGRDMAAADWLRGHAERLTGPPTR